jgi:hypothetical protein
MIAYQEYNTKSPLNGLAAKWAAQNANLLPVDPRTIAPPDGHADPAAAPASKVIATAIPAPAPLTLPVQPAEDPWSAKIVIE